LSQTLANERIFGGLLVSKKFSELKRRSPLKVFQAFNGEKNNN
jgi:hypothetical protein